MSVNVIRAKLSTLRKNFPNAVNEPLARDFNSMIQQLEEELQDPEISNFVIPEADIKPRIVSFVPGRSVNYSKDKYCDNGVFKRHLEGLWAYLEDIGIVETQPSKQKPPKSHSTINFNAPVTGSVIQQGNDNTATLNYESDVRHVIEEIRPLLNAAKLNPEAKQELRAEFETVEAQIKSPKPKHAIIRESLQSVRHIFEHALGATMAHTALPLLAEFLKHH
jgi:hypothetical protein